MPNNLVRTTTYFDPKLLNLAKKQAIDEGKSFYEFLNEKLLQGMELVIPKRVAPKQKKFVFDKVFKTFPLGFKNVKREDAYEK